MRSLTDADNLRQIGVLPISRTISMADPGQTACPAISSDFHIGHNSAGNGKNNRSVSGSRSDEFSTRVRFAKVVLRSACNRSLDVLMIFLLDNYDSFTWNLVQRIGEIDDSLTIKVERNDQTSLAAIEALQPERIIVSPGPCTPVEAGLSRDLIRHFGPRLPVLGVCLGHQCMADVYGARVERANRLMHGKTSLIHHDGAGVFEGLPDPFQATRYHSLIVPRESIPDCLKVTAWVDDEGHDYEVMGLQHREYPVYGVQFHPESFLTDRGYDLLRNFLAV